jgi:hypothetical protein
MNATYERALVYRTPLLRGEDVLAVQLRLRDLEFPSVGQPDGWFGRKTETAVRGFQSSHGLKVDGVVGPRTWKALFEQTSVGGPQEKIGLLLPDLKKLHGYRNSVKWRLEKEGVHIEGSGIETSGGQPKTVRRVWARYGDSVNVWAGEFGVPAELIVATICTESGGDAAAVREEPRYESDELTPHQVSPGLMQTLISTAREALGDDTIDRAWLLQPDNSIRAGTAYIAGQWKTSHLDPPKVACAYNAGRIRHNDSAENRWKMLQYPIGTGHHADRFVEWFNDCFRMFESDGIEPKIGFYDLL